MDYKSAIKMMFYQGCGTNERIPTSVEYKNLLNKVIDLEKEFLAILNDYPKIKDIYNKLRDTEDLLDSERDYDCFREGIKFGLFLGLEVTDFIKDE